MDDPAVVGRLNGLRQRGYEGGGLHGGTRGACERLCEAPPLDELHGEVHPPVVLTNIVDLHDVDMAQARRGLGLPSESLPFLRAGIGAGQQHLDGDRAVEALIPRPVHDAHAAMA